MKVLAGSSSYPSLLDAFFVAFPGFAGVVAEDVTVFVFFHVFRVGWERAALGWGALADKVCR